jgi:hypothetical protein
MSFNRLSEGWDCMVCEACFLIADCTHLKIKK